ETESWRLRGDGTRFCAEVSLTALVGERGRLRGFSMVIRDVTERRRLEDALRHRADELSEANRLKDEFLAVLSHELRTPLNAILGWTRLLRTRPFEADQLRSALDIIERNSKLQAQLIDDLLDVSRIISGNLRLNVRPLDLRAV